MWFLPEGRKGRCKFTEVHVHLMGESARPIDGGQDPRAFGDNREPLGLLHGRGPGRRGTHLPHWLCCGEGRGADRSGPGGWLMGQGLCRIQGRDGGARGRAEAGGPWVREGGRLFTGFYKPAKEEMACSLLRRLSGVSYQCGRGRQVE